jgi:hypothetical protein
LSGRVFPYHSEYTTGIRISDRKAADTMPPTSGAAMRAHAGPNPGGVERHVG